MDQKRFVVGMVVLILIGGVALWLAQTRPGLSEEPGKSVVAVVNVVAPPTADIEPTGVRLETAVPPTATHLPVTQTPTHSLPLTPSPTPTPTSVPLQINGLTLDRFIILSPEVLQHSREIFANGQVWGRDASRFSKLGDSLIATPHFLTPFDDTSKYNLGEFAYLQPTIDFFAGSFERYGVAVRAGLHAWGVFDPLWANKEWCEANENMLDCEIRLNNPAVLLIFLGSNDNGSAEAFRHNVEQVVETTISHGVIPVLVTKADRFEGGDNRNNNMIREIAQVYQVPLWDFDLFASTLPGRGLGEDLVHLTVFPENDYTLPVAFERGYAMHNLTALMMLDVLRQEVVLAGE